MSLTGLQKKLQYEFNNKELLKLALVHKSSNNSSNNERLEFLGDTILNSVISQYLFEKFPHEKEGLLDKKLASLVVLANNNPPSNSEVAGLALRAALVKASAATSSKPCNK